MPRKLLVGGPPPSGSVRSVTVKKVSPPTVPALSRPLTNHKRHSSGSNPCIVCNGDFLLEEVSPDLEDSDFGFRKKANSTSGVHPIRGVYIYQNQQQQRNLSFLKKMSGGSRTGSNGQIHLAHVTVHSQPDSLPSTPLEPLSTPGLLKGRQMSGTQVSLEDQGIDVSSPGRHSPGGSSGGSSVSRHSLSSLDSGRASAPGSKVSVKRRLSVQSCGDGGFANQRSSYHSSSSSIASSGDDPQCAAGSVLGPNVAEMVLHGLPDVEVLNSWLASLHFEEYTSLFLQAGYDMPTITRMTPEDLTAIGITKPNHRRKMKAEIAKLNISDGIPEYKPNTLLEWLKLLRLEEYYSTLCQQKYDTIDRVTELTWEDLEDIGIQKLGHQKKILLAIKRVEDINQGRRPNLIPQALVPQPVQTPPTNCNYSNYSRPNVLTNVQPYAYPAEEIAIATNRSKNSPSTDSIPEMKTFLQPGTIAEDGTCQSMTNPAGLLAPSTNHHNGSANPALSPCRGRSLESLPSAEEPTPIVSNPIHPPVTTYKSAPTAQVERPKVQLIKDWKTTDLDSVDYGYECEGTATLNRPKGLVKLRPVAKVSAKTREEIAEIITDIPGEDFKNLISQGRTLDGWSSLDGSPRRGSSSSSTVPRASTLRRPPPPPPPKRTNSARGDANKTEEPSSIPRNVPPPPPARNKPSLPPSNVVHQKNTTTAQVAPPQKPEELIEEEFPPPPSPLLSAVEAESKSLVNQGAETTMKSEGSGGLEELFNNPLFRQKRKDSTSSVDGTILPATNEASGTAKENAPKQFPSLPIEVSLRSTAKDRNPGRNISQTNQNEYDRNSEAISPGDVIDDIEHMLANLSDQLDAMLDEEQVQK